MRYLPSALIIVLAAVLAYFVVSSPSARAPNRAEQFLHLIAPAAVCTDLYSGEGVFPDSADCVVGSTILFCRASTIAPPTCVKIYEAPVAPSPKTP